MKSLLVTKELFPCIRCLPAPFAERGTQPQPTVRGRNLPATPAALSWTITRTKGGRAPIMAAPKDPAENAEEDEADLELETDEEQSQLPQAGRRPGAEDGSTAARGDDTINPSFP